MAIDGLFSPLRRYLASFSIEIGGMKNPAFWHLFGQGLMVKWLSIGLFAVALLAFVFKGKPGFGLNKNKTLGVGAVVAGGCSLGHGITGVSTGALSSVMAITAIVMGNWTMTYFKYIRPAG